MALSRANLAKAVTSAFTALGDIPEASTLRRYTNTHDTSTGDTTSTSIDYTIDKAIFTKYDAHDVDRQFILTTDVKLLVRQSEFTITISKITDKIVRNSKEYNIVTIKEDPAALIYIIQLRAP